MNNQITAKNLMDKAKRALESARVLLEIGDADGAANRAYYAMFDAARAALLASSAEDMHDIGRTHSGLISAFSQRLVKNGLMSKDMGRLLNRAYETRQVADYNGVSVELSDIAQMVEKAEAFITAVQLKFM